MANLQINQVSLAFGDRDILKNVSLTLSARSRIALAGANGCGKTTLLKICGSITKSDSGSVTMDPKAILGYLPQTGLEFQGSSLWHEAEKAFKRFHILEEECHGLTSRLEDEALDSKTKDRLLHQWQDKRDIIEGSSYYQRDSIISRVLTGLGFHQEDFQRETSSFSGGWQMRIALAKVLLEEPDFLLLDEPTNYLDLEARQWLSDFLQSFEGGILIVSHDRHFLDSLIQQVAELYLGKLTIYKGNYSYYQNLRMAELEQIQDQYKEQQKEIARIEDFIRRFRSKATKAAQVQSRVKMLEKMDIIEIPDNLRKVSLTFPEPPHSGSEVLRIRGLSRNYGPLKVLQNIDLDVSRGDKLALCGVNGAGKSTLMRILAGVDKDYQGELVLGTQVKVGYFAQDQDNWLNKENSLIQELEEVSSTEDYPRLRSMAGSFLFSGDDIFKKVEFLSGGEKNRLALLKMLLKPFNLLVMDEPTNHLDIHSKDILLQALKDYSGTLIFVSHDQSFIEGLAEQVLELKPGSHKLYQGDYQYYQYLKAKEVATELDDQSQHRLEKVEVTTKASQMTRQEEKELKAKIRRLTRQEETLMEEISRIEEEISHREGLLSQEEYYSDGERAAALSRELEELREKAHASSLEWEQVGEELQKLQE